MALPLFFIYRYTFEFGLVTLFGATEDGWLVTSDSVKKWNVEGEKKDEGSIMDAILTRRSIRHYTAQPVAEELITGFLKAAMAAPSAGNEQPWEFVVLTERTILDRIPSFHPYAAMLREAPAAILVCGDLAREKHEGYWVQDCSAATENILIAVNEKGLGAVWLGIFPGRSGCGDCGSFSVSRKPLCRLPWLQSAIPRKRKSLLTGLMLHVCTIIPGDRSTH